jgi:hypothetical protein
MMRGIRRIEQRIGGFDVGHWASTEELAFIEQQKTRLGHGKRSTGLYKNEADISLAARAHDSIVISLDHKAGPINHAYKQSGMVVFLTDFDGQDKSLNQFIKFKRSVNEGESSFPACVRILGA